MPRRTKKQQAEDELLFDWIEGLPLEYEMCRDTGHAMRAVDTWRLTYKFIGQRVECSNGCGRFYRRILDPNGNVATTWDQTYGTGYLKPKDATPGRVDRALFRVVRAESTMNGSKPPEEMVSALKTFMSD